MARYMTAKAHIQGVSGQSTTYSPDSVLAFSGRYNPANLSQQQGVPIAGAQSGDDEILDLWDSIWFGVSNSPTQLPVRPAKATLDPLAVAFPLFSTAHVMQPVTVRAAYQQHSIAQQPDQSLQEQEAYLPHQQAGGLLSDSNAVANKAEVQQVAVIAEAATAAGRGMFSASTAHAACSHAVNKSSSSSSIDMLAPKQAQQQQQQDSDQPTAGPAPYVLGTWAQRQFIMPLDRNKSSPQQQAANSQTAGVPGTSVPQPIRWPSGSSNKSAGSSNGSKGSGQTGTAAPVGQEAPVLTAAAGANLTGGQTHGGNAAAVAAAAAAAAAVDVAMGARRSISTDDEEEAVTQAAWRWRFAKRWQAEQVRGPVDAAASMGDGGMEEALQYLAACGENWHLARVTCTEVGGTADSRLLGTLGTPSLLGHELLVDESFSAHGSGRGLLQSTGSGGLGCGFLSREASHSGGAGRGEATQQVTTINKRAAQLLAAQSDINKAATQRWREVQTTQASDLWAGALLESVEVDDWGKYKFLLLRLRDRAGRQKLLVRGANYASDAKIVEGLHRQMMSACAQHDVCAEAIEVVGGGVMEWRRDRDRHLHISNGYVSPSGGPGGPSTGIEVVNLAAVLTKQHLPMHYKVTSDGGKVL